MSSGHLVCSSPFADFGKFIMKEVVIPAGADKYVFMLAPLLTFVLAAIIWVVVPLRGWLGDF